jgi:hypothetical protein
MTSKDVKTEILNGIFRTKDGLSSNELTELLNTLIEVARLEGKPASLDTLIQRVEGLKITKDVKYLASDKDIYNGAIEETVEILRSVPVIKAKALRKKGTGEWYEYDLNTDFYFTSELPTLYKSENDISSNTPADAELVTIEILLP